MTLVMKPFGWNVAFVDGLLACPGLVVGILHHPNYLLGFGSCIFIWCIGTYQICTLNTEEMNEIPTQNP